MQVTARNRFHLVTLMREAERRSGAGARHVRAMRLAHYAESFPDSYPTDVVSDAVRLLLECDADVPSELSSFGAWDDALEAMVAHV